MSLRVAPTLTLPPQAVTETFGILAARGAGKSNTAAVMAEEMFAAKLPFVVIDPVRAWWGLRSSRDGKGPGLSIPIFGGTRGDVPLERGAGTLIADLIVEHRLSCVLDISDFDSEGSKKQFLLDFARRLYQKNEHPLHLFLEEADDYIPQRPMRDEAMLLRAWENIVRRGRGRGLGCTLITQRSASLNKNVLTQVQTLVPMRTTGPQDIAAIREWVKFNHQSEDILASLPELEDGEAWVWSPHFLKKTVRVRFRRRETFDSGATPKVSSTAAKAPATLADVDLPAVKARMAATIEKQKAEDPKALRAEVARLRAELAKRAAPVAAAKEKRIEVPVVKEAQIKRVEAVIHAAEKLNERTLKAIGELARAVSQASVEGAVHVRFTKDEPVFSERRVFHPTVPSSTSARVTVTGDATLPKAEGAILRAAAQRHPRRSSRSQLSILSGYSITSSSFDNALGSLRGKGLLDGLGDDNGITEAGLTAAGPVEPPPTGTELAAWWQAKLPKAERTLLGVLVDAGGGALNREQLSERSGYSESSSSFDNALGKLRTLELIVGYGNAIKASEDLL